MFLLFPCRRTFSNLFVGDGCSKKKRFILSMPLHHHHHHVYSPLTPHLLTPFFHFSPSLALLALSLSFVEEETQARQEAK
jgi:hypothetical protein